jgi:hypothetical protein
VSPRLIEVDGLAYFALPTPRGRTVSLKMKDPTPLYVAGTPPARHLGSKRDGNARAPLKPRN